MFWQPGIFNLIPTLSWFQERENVTASLRALHILGEVVIKLKAEIVKKSDKFFIYKTHLISDFHV